MAEFRPSCRLREGGGRFGQPIFPRSSQRKLSAKDFLHRLDLQIINNLSRQRGSLKEEEVRSNEEDYTAPSSSYQEI
ncbi:hypothetical protein KUCAC02_002699 [Chaenocephalus aceratus]|uniref:Uncharacterized protein n=1 Tax=Chaenocephalus aceratus TaxID=36190 RepID=A0ACB9XWA1_CHAAC|nr:hypothetical protein KUCAC02_002699 [Chaenocephalus aceratus]